MPIKTYASIKTYSSKSNAKRAAKTLLDKLPAGFTANEPKQCMEDWLFEVVSDKPQVTLSPDVLELLTPFAVTYPAAPATNEPLLPRPNMKPYAEWDFSECHTPVAVCREVYSAYLQRGDIDDRKGAIATAMSVGVQRNTAHTQYRRFRIQNGLPGAVNPK